MNQPTANPGLLMLLQHMLATTTVAVRVCSFLSSTHDEGDAQAVVVQL